MVLAVERDEGGGFVGAGSGFRQGGARRGDREHAAPGGDDVAVFLGGAGVEDGDAGDGGSFGEAADRVAGARGRRVIVCGEHEREGGAIAGDRDGGGIEGAARGGDEELGEIAGDELQDGLTLGVAEADVVLEEEGVAGGRDHEAGEEDAAEGGARALHAREGGGEDLALDAGEEVGREASARRERAHAAGVGARVAVADTFVIARGGEHEIPFAVADREHADLFAEERVFEDDGRARIAEHPVDEHGARGVERFVFGGGDDDPFARAEAARLHDDRRAVLADVGGGVLEARDGDEGGGRDVLACGEGLEEGLGSFELRGRSLRAEREEAGGGERVDHARDEGRLGADHDEVGALLVGGGDDRVDREGALQRAATDGRAVRGDVTGGRGGAGVAGENDDVCHRGGSGEPTSERVLARARADDQHPFATRSSWARWPTANRAALRAPGLCGAPGGEPRHSAGEARHSWKGLF